MEKNEEGETDKTIIKVRSPQDLGCQTLQSPDDIEATYKKKREESYHGYSVLGVETCHPENEVNLITNLKVGNNQMDDAQILEDTLEEIVEETGLEEGNFDGGFGSEGVDAKAQELGVTIIQTAIKGRSAKVPIKIEGSEEEGFTVSCPYEEQPSVKATFIRKNYKVEFDLERCKTCPFKDNCPTRWHQNEAKGIASHSKNS